MVLKVLPARFSVCKIRDVSQVNWQDEFLFLGKTDEEISLVCAADSVPRNCTACEHGWRAFRIEGKLDFSLVGVLSQITKALAENRISVFAVSTYNTDYILVKEKQLDAAVQACAHAGWSLL